MCQALHTCCFTWYSWHSCTGAVTAFTLQKTDWDWGRGSNSSQGHVPNSNGVQFLIQACRFRSQGSLMVLCPFPQKEFHRRKAHNTLGSVLLVNVAATAWTSRCGRLTSRRNPRLQCSPAGWASAGTHHIASRCSPPLDPGTDRVGKKCFSCCLSHRMEYFSRCKNRAFGTFLQHPTSVPEARRCCTHWKMFSVNAFF